MPVEAGNGRPIGLASGEGTPIAFVEGRAGRPTGIVPNPGAWQIEATRLD